MRIKFTAALMLLAAFCAAQNAEPRGKLRYSPASKAFACDLPIGWNAFEEEEPWGFVVHMLGPDSPQNDFRAGIDVRYFEKGSPGFVPVKNYVDDLRRSDSETGRSSTAPRALRVAGTLSRIFEVTETRRLPFDGLPGIERELHHYYAIIPSGDSYFTVSLSSTRDSYLDYRALFVDFLRDFRPMGSGR